MKKSTAIIANFVLALPALAFWSLTFAYHFVEGGGERYSGVIAWIFVSPITFILLAPWLCLAVKFRKQVIWWLGLLFGMTPSIWMTAQFGDFLWLTFWFK